MPRAASASPGPGPEFLMRVHARPGYLRSSHLLEAHRGRRLPPPQVVDQGCPAAEPCRARRGHRGQHAPPAADPSARPHRCQARVPPGRQHHQRMGRAGNLQPQVLRPPAALPRHLVERREGGPHRARLHVRADRGPDQAAGRPPVEKPRAPPPGQRRIRRRSTPHRRPGLHLAPLSLPPLHRAARTHPAQRA